MEAEVIANVFTEGFAPQIKELEVESIKLLIVFKLSRVFKDFWNTNFFYNGRKISWKSLKSFASHKTL